VIDLLLLGTGAMVPLPHRPLSSLLIRSGGSLVLFDCGEGTQVQMRKFHWGFRRLDAVCLSHLHADHVAGLPGLFHTVANAGRTEPMHVYGPPGTVEVIEGLRVIARHLPYDMMVHELVDGDRTGLPGGLRAQVCDASHRIPCLAWRVDMDRAPAFDPVRAESLGVPRTQWSSLQRGEPVDVAGRIVQPSNVLGEARKGISFAFVTDTRPTDGIVELVQGADLLVSEATYMSDDARDGAHRFGHMTLRDACEQARAADVGVLWLTHFSGSIDDPLAYRETARDLFPDAEIGRPGLTARLSFSNGYEVTSAE
jgi:ribonuclease Z